MSESSTAVTPDQGERRTGCAVVRTEVGPPGAVPSSRWRFGPRPGLATVALALLVVASLITAAATYFFLYAPDKHIRFGRKGIGDRGSQFRHRRTAVVLPGHTHR